MPLYDYECNSCGDIFTVGLKIADRNNPLVFPCTKCGKIEVQRVYSVAPNKIDPGILKADKRMEDSGVQRQLERIRDQCNPNMEWKG